MFKNFQDNYEFWKWIDTFKYFIDDSINCTLICQGYEAILLGYKWFVSCKLNQFLHKFRQVFLTHLPLLDIFGHKIAKIKVFLLSYFRKKLLGDKLEVFFNIEEESIFTAVCHSVVPSFCHSVNLSETLTLLLTFKHWVIEVWYFTLMFCPFLQIKELILKQTYISFLNILVQFQYLFI